MSASFSRLSYTRRRDPLGLCGKCCVASLGKRLRYSHPLAINSTGPLARRDVLRVARVVLDRPAAACQGAEPALPRAMVLSRIVISMQYLRLLDFDLYHARMCGGIPEPQNSHPLLRRRSMHSKIFMGRMPDLLVSIVPVGVRLGCGRQACADGLALDERRQQGSC